MTHALIARPITPGERPEVIAFAKSMYRSYEHFDFPRGQAFTWPGYAAWDAQGRLAGVLGAWLDRPPVASILYAAADAWVSPSEVIAALLAPLEEDLVRAGASELVFIGLAPWLCEALRVAGFTQRNSVVSYQLWRWDGPLEGSTQVTLRAGRLEDAEAVTALDRVCFEPMWRYTVAAHRSLIERLPHYTIATLGDRIVGYEASDLVYGQGQIIRLVVGPDDRRQGIGSGLLANAIRFFRDRQVRWLMLNTQSDNYASRRLYERFGFEPAGEEVPVMVKNLA